MSGNNGGGSGGGGVDARTRGGDVSPGSVNVNQQMAFVAAQDLLRCNMWSMW